MSREIKKQEFSCYFCKNKFKAWSSQNRKYCSDKCRLQSLHETTPQKKMTGTIELCKVCKNKFYVPLWRKRRDGGKYCSKECYWKDKSIQCTGKKLSPEICKKISESKIGKKRSIETIKKMSTIMKGNKLWLGRHHTEETKKKMSEAWKNRVVSAETRKRISKANKGRKHSEETKRKIGLGNKGKILSDKTREKICIARAKQKFPFNDTSIELKIQEELKKLNIKFEKHHSIKGLNSGHCVDIFIQPNIVIEADGNYWHDIQMRPKQAERDFNQTIEMVKKGFIVLRFFENEINNDINIVMDTIREYL